LLGTRWGRRLVVLVHGVLIVVGVGWYFNQPPSRQQEIERLLVNYFQQEKDVQLFELAVDLYQYYYGNQFIASEFDAKRNLIYGGVPKAEGGIRFRVLKNQGYVCGYSETRRSPLWVAYRLSDQARPQAAAERPSGFDTDSRTLARVQSAEYSRSGYDRGHLAPNYGIFRCYGRKAQLETFLMSNIVPQKHEMNAGLWRYLEERAAINYPARFGEIWIVTGPVFGRRAEVIGKGVPVPEGFFKIMIDETEGKVRTQAYLIPQSARAEQGLRPFMVSIDEIERRVGIDFFPLLADEAERKLEASVASAPW